MGEWISAARSVNEQNFADLDKLYAYLASLSEDTDVRMILKGPTDAGQFYRQYHHIFAATGQRGVGCVELI